MKCLILSTLTLLFVVESLGQNWPPCISGSCPDNPRLVCQDNKCICDEGYRYSGLQNGKIECDTVLGSECSANEDCFNLPEAECDNRKCICKTGTVPGENKCLSAAQSRDEPCFQKSQCVPRFGEFSKCEGTCLCESGYHFGEEDKCVKDIGLGESCTANKDDCYLSVDDVNALQCAEDKCSCKEGFTPTENTCKGGATSVIISMVTMVFFVFVVLKV